MRIGAASRLGIDLLGVGSKENIALGVSGAPEHLEGMGKADCIIAINGDASAPTFGAAHIGATADMIDVLAEPIDALDA